MKILVLSINYWPEQTGIGAVVTRRCEYLASVGHEVTVCTGMPYYPEWRIDASYAGKSFVREKHNGVTILRSWLWVPRKVSSAKRILFEASFLATSFLTALKHRSPDLLFVVSPPLGLGLSAIILKSLWNIPYVFDVEDLQPDSAADLAMLPGPVLPLLYKLEAAAYKHAALITTVSRGMRRKIIAKGLPPDKVVTLPAAADNSLFEIDGASCGHAFRAKHDLHGKFFVAHSGNMGVKQGLDVVLDAASILRENKEIVFLLAGDGVMRPHLARRAADLKLENVQFLPVQGQTDYLQMLAAIDTALVVQQSTVSDIAFPSKTVTLLSAARPVVASVNDSSEVSDIIRQANAGVVIEPEKPELLARSIQKLFEDPSMRSAMGESGRNYALTHWHEKQVLTTFESQIAAASSVGVMAAPQESNAA